MGGLCDSLCTSWLRGYKESAFALLRITKMTPANKKPCETAGHLPLNL